MTYLNQPIIAGTAVPEGDEKPVRLTCINARRPEQGLAIAPEALSGIRRTAVDCERVRVSTSEAIGGRVVLAGVMGSIAFAFIVLLVAAAGLPITVGLLVAALAGAGLIAAWLARSAASVRSGWGRGCLVNGLLSAAVAAGFGAQDELWSGRSGYIEDLDQAIGPLTHFVWALAARVGLIALILAAVLFALSCWLLGPPHRKA